jgi:hypothetical protein
MDYKLKNIYANKILKEEYHLFAKGDYDDEPQYIGSLEDAYYHTIRRRIIANQKGSITEITETLLEKALWKSHRINPREFNAILLEPILNFLYNITDVLDVNAYNILVEKKETLNWLEKAILSETPFNLYEGAKSTISHIFEQPAEIFNAIYNLTGLINNVSFGRGEVVLTMFSNAVKGKDRGDLYIENIGEIEIKGSRARLGSSGRIALNAVNLLPEFLQKKKKKNVFTGIQLQQKSKEVISQLIGNKESILSKIDQLIDKLTSKKDTTSLIEIRDKLLELYNKHDLFYGTTNLSQLNIEINNIFAADSELSKNQKLKTKINNFFIDLIKLKSDTGKVIPDKKQTWNRVVKSTFTVNWGLSIDDYVDALMYLINEEEIQNDNNIKSQYKEALKEDILSPEVFFNLVNGDRNNFLAPIVATIHLLSYHLKYKFPAILLTNNNTLNAFPIVFEKEGNVRIKFSKLFKTFTNNQFDFELNLNNQSSGGIAVTYIG